MLTFCEMIREYLEYAGLVSVAFGLPHIAVKAFRTMTRFQFDANCLMLFATLGAIALKDFVEAAAVAFLFSLSEWLEVRATSRAREALSSIVNLRPEKANLIHPRTKELVVVPVGVVPVGAVVSVKSGEKIPCDGVVVEGSTTVDESVRKTILWVCSTICLYLTGCCVLDFKSPLLESRDQCARFSGTMSKEARSILAILRL
jgi:Zn2+/Cd2+-exporting ATPase